MSQNGPPIPKDLDFRTRVVAGRGALARLGELAAGLGVRRVLLVTDPGVRRAGHTQAGADSLEAAGLEVTVFDGVQQDPTTEDAGACARAAGESGAEAFVGLGGGSCIDAAKAGNFLLTNGGRMQDYWGWAKAREALLPLVAVPTTAGTGSEVQSFALIEDAETHAKMACGDPSAAPRVALLDPLLTLSVPRSVTAHTGVDTLTHAVECAVTRTATPYSAMLAREAFRLGHTALPTALDEPEDVEAREAMQWSATLAGMAIEASMLGAAHSMANPFTARFDVPHGQAVGLFLPLVVRFNARSPEVAGGYRQLAVAAGLVPEGAPAASAVTALTERIGALLDVCGVPESIDSCGAVPGDLPAMAEEAAGQWTAGHNPVPVTPRDFEGLYAQALERCR